MVVGNIAHVHDQIYRVLAEKPAGKLYALARILSRADVRICHHTHAQKRFFAAERVKSAACNGRRTDSTDKFTPSYRHTETPSPAIIARVPSLNDTIKFSPFQRASPEPPESEMKSQP